MNLLITGGAGFLGQKLARRLLQDGQIAGEPVQRIVLVDQTAAPYLGDARVRTFAAAIADLTAMSGLALPNVDLVFHLAAAVSGAAGGRAAVDLIRDQRDPAVEGDRRRLAGGLGQPARRGPGPEARSGLRRHRAGLYRGRSAAAGALRARSGEHSFVSFFRFPMPRFRPRLYNRRRSERH